MSLWRSVRKLLGKDDVQQAVGYAIIKRRQVAAGKAVGFVAANPDWAEERIAAADAVRLAYEMAIAEGHDPTTAALMGARALCIFIVRHS